MNDSAESQSVDQLMPGFSRQMIGDSVKISFHWYNAISSGLNKIVEWLLLLAGLTTIYLTFNGITRLFSGTGDFFQGAMSFLFFLLGFVFAYRGLALFINRSVFVINRDGFLSYHRPLPFPGAANLELPSKEIANIEWRKVGHVSRRANSGSTISAGYSATFDVVLQTTGGESITLIPGIRAREYAFAIATELSKTLQEYNSTRE